MSASRSNVRRSLPRAIFTDLSIVPQSQESQSSDTSDPQSVPVGDHRLCSRQLLLDRRTSTGSQVVLMRNTHGRGQLTIPVKRNRSKGPRHSQKTSPIVRGRTTTSKRTPKSRRSTQICAKTTPKKRGSTAAVRRRFVQETPNPNRSHPRWERARMAAAEKTKDKAIVVSESPLKPKVSPSALGRLRRVNSAFSCLFKRTGVNPKSQPQSPGLFSQSPSKLSSGGRTPIKACRQSSICVSRTMSRAEQWCQRQYDEELSLSQYSAPTFPTSSAMPYSGPKRRSNLCANITSPECPSTPKKTIISPLRPLNLIKSSIASPAKLTKAYRVQLCNSLDRAAQSPFIASLFPTTPPPSRLPASAITVASATRKTGRKSNRRQRYRSAEESHPVITSPDLYDQEAMFLCREEFLNHSLTGVGSNVAGSSVENPSRPAIPLPVTASFSPTCKRPTPSEDDLPSATQYDDTSSSASVKRRRLLRCGSSLVALDSSRSATSEGPSSGTMEQKRPVLPRHCNSAVDSDNSREESCSTPNPPHTPGKITQRMNDLCVSVPSYSNDSSTVSDVALDIRSNTGRQSGLTGRRLPRRVRLDGGDPKVCRPSTRASVSRRGFRFGHSS